MKTIFSDLCSISLFPSESNIQRHIMDNICSDTNLTKFQNISSVKIYVYSMKIVESASNSLKVVIFRPFMGSPEYAYDRAHIKLLYYVYNVNIVRIINYRGRQRAG